jgi:hypothetical protein
MPEKARPPLRQRRLSGLRRRATFPLACDPPLRGRALRSVRMRTNGTDGVRKPLGIRSVIRAPVNRHGWLAVPEAVASVLLPQAAVLDRQTSVGGSG